MNRVGSYVVRLNATSNFWLGRKDCISLYSLSFQFAYSGGSIDSEPIRARGIIVEYI